MIEEDGLNTAESGAIVDYLIDAPLCDDDWLVDNALSGADVMMSFVAKIAATRGPAEQPPRLMTYARRLQARPA